MANPVLCGTDEHGIEYEIDLPVKYDVCPTCRGNGKHVNPSVDGSGLTYEDFDEDPDLEQAYFAGAYDVQCYECSGLRVVQVVDINAMSASMRAEYEAQCEFEAVCRREEAWERRMGA